MPFNRSDYLSAETIRPYLQDILSGYFTANQYESTIWPYTKEQFVEARSAFVNTGRALASADVIRALNLITVGSILSVMLWTSDGPLEGKPQLEEFSAEANAEFEKIKKAIRDARWGATMSTEMMTFALSYAGYQAPLALAKVLTQTMKSAASAVDMGSALVTLREQQAARYGTAIRNGFLVPLDCPNSHNYTLNFPLYVESSSTTCSSSYKIINTTGISDVTAGNNLIERNSQATNVRPAVPSDALAFVSRLSQGHIQVLASTEGLFHRSKVFSAVFSNDIESILTAYNQALDNIEFLMNKFSPTEQVAEPGGRSPVEAFRHMLTQAEPQRVYNAPRGWEVPGRVPPEVTELEEPDTESSF